MAYSTRSEYLEVRRRSRALAAVWVVADVAYYVGLVGGICGTFWFPIRWVFDLLRGTAGPWIGYAAGTLVTAVTAVFLVALSVHTCRAILHRLKLR